MAMDKGISRNVVQVSQKSSEKFSATRYHSLIINEKELSPELSITARSANDNYIMAVSHKEYPTFGIQFHPESIATEHGIDILRNFIIL